MTPHVCFEEWRPHPCGLCTVMGVVVLVAAALLPSLDPAVPLAPGALQTACEKEKDPHRAGERRWMTMRNRATDTKAHPALIKSHPNGRFCVVSPPSLLHARSPPLSLPPRLSVSSTAPLATLSVFPFSPPSLHPLISALGGPCAAMADEP